MGDSKELKRFRHTRLRLVQEEYALLVGGKEDIVKLRSLEDIDTLRYKKIKDTLKKWRVKIDKWVAEYSPKRPLPSINRPDLAIIRVAVAEGFISKEVPPKVAINEAVEIAKKFGTAGSYRFVNAVLGRILRERFPELLQEVKSSEQKDGKNNKTDAK